VRRGELGSEAGDLIDIASGVGEVCGSCRAERAAEPRDGFRILRILLVEFGHGRFVHRSARLLIKRVKAFEEQTEGLDPIAFARSRRSLSDARPHRRSP
jgi:hypothetical protein